MNRLIKGIFRLFHDMPEDEMDFHIGGALNLVFLALIALLLWPLDQTRLTVRLAKGYEVFWGVTLITAFVVGRIQRIFRINVDRHIDAFVLSNLSLSFILLAGWSAFAVLTVRSLVVATPVWMAVILYLVGFLSSYVAYIVISSFYQGSIYRVVNLPVAMASFLVFAVWPTSGRVIYGWFFDLFEKVKKG